MACKVIDKTQQEKDSKKHPGSKITIKKITQKCANYSDDLQEEEEAEEEQKTKPIELKDSEDKSLQEEKNIILSDTDEELLERWNKIINK